MKSGHSRPAVTLALSLLVALPLLTLAVQSVALRWYYPALLPQEWTLHGWSSLLSPGTRLPEALGGSLWTALLTALSGVLLAAPAARALAARPRPLLRALLLSPLVVPVFAAALGVQVVFLRLHLADTRAGVVLVQLIPVLPYALTLLTAAFQRHDLRLEQQARSLGASPVQVARLVTLPALAPGLGLALTLCFLVSWGDYLLTLTVGGGQVLTLPVLLLASAQGGDTALTAALALAYVLPPMLLFLLAWWAGKGRLHLEGTVGQHGGQGYGPRRP